MYRKLILTLCFVLLAATLMGCAAKKTSSPAARSPTLPAQPVPTDSPALPPTAAPSATSEPTATSAPLPATETPTTPPTYAAIATPETTGPVIPRLESGQAVTITWIHMQDAASGWAIGGQGQAGDHVLITADGGQTWRDVTPAEPASADGSLEALGYFADARSAWVTYRSQNEMVIPTSARVWRTQDAGQTWLPSDPLDLAGLAEVYWPSDLVFADPQNGWLLIHVGAGMSHDYVALFRTQDGGQTWARLLDPYNDGGIQACQKNGLVFPSPQNGWLTGDCGGVMAGAFLFQTSDAGQTWQSVTLAAPAEAFGLFSNPVTYCGTQSPVFSSPQDGKLILRCLDTTQDPYVTHYYLYTTHDGGAAWVPSSSPAGMLEFTSGENGWALGRDLFHTTDGGQTWSKVKTVNWDGQFSFVNDQLGWAVARAETDTATLLALVQTTDGGQNWTEIHPVIAP